MKRFGSERIKAFMERMNLTEEESVIKSKMLTRQVEAAQKRVEGNNYDSRKQVLQYDDVMREQREIIYSQRHEVITADRDLGPEIKAMILRTIERQVEGHFLGSKEEAVTGIVQFAHANLVEDGSLSIASLEELDKYEIIDELYERALQVYDSQMKKLRDEERIREFQKVLILRVVDNKWTDHIDALDQLRNAVSLRGYAQNNPIVEYQSEAFTMFNDMIGAIEFEVTRLMMKAQIHDNIERERAVQEAHTTAVKNIMPHQSNHAEEAISFEGIDRNDPCPCQSGKKFKNCHGRK